MRRNYFGTAALLLLALAAEAQDVIVDNTAATYGGSDAGVPILMYHGLDADHGQDPAGFNAQMDYLAANNFTTITLDHLKSWIETGAPALPAKPLVITFDDDYITVYSVAYPKMKALQDAGATLFGYNYAHTAYVGVAPGGSPPTSYDHADWDECSEMEDAGVLFTESHTVTHRNLTTLSAADRTAELVNSKAAIESNMSKTVRHLAYPYGAYDADVIVRTQAAGYETAVTTIAGVNTRSTPLYELRRYNVVPNMYTNSTFTSTLSGSTGGAPWTVSTGAPGYYGANYQYAEAGTGERTATWNFTIPATGTYEVFAWWAQSSNRATNAPYTIAHAGGTTTVRVDQTTNGGGWYSLGQFAFDAGAGSVVLSNDANGIVIADAIRVAGVVASVGEWWILN